MTLQTDTTATAPDRASPGNALAHLLQSYSIEVTTHDHGSLDAATRDLTAGAEVFVANPTNESAGAMAATAARVREAGFAPVPHIVARNVANREALDDLLARLAGEASVDKVLAVGGDRDDPTGDFDSALQVIETGLFQKHGIGRIALACYPEGHPRIADETLETALNNKLTAATRAGLDVLLISQFLFEPMPIVALAGRLRESGVTAPLRVGVAGPASRSKLIKYALRCGVGPSLRALRERRDMGWNVLSGESPGELLAEVAQARAADSSLGIDGVHFFTFGDPAGSVRWAEARRALATST